MRHVKIIHHHVVFPLQFWFVRNPRLKSEIAGKCTKTAGQILADIAEQAVTPALVTYSKGVKIDICCRPFGQHARKNNTPR